MTGCHACLKELEITSPVGRRSVCDFCGADLHCCLNCVFYQRGAYNDCKEPQAERVIEKSRSNFCDYFVFGDSVIGGKEKASGNIGDAKSKLASLFKKG